MNEKSEILQSQTPSELNDDLSYERIGEDISCNLGSTIIDNMIHSPNIEKSVEVLTRALTKVSEKTSIDMVPTVKEGNNRNHAIGIGAMGLASSLAKNQIRYGSEEALEFTDAYFRVLRFFALKASNKIAKEKGETFESFQDSEYADGSYIKERYIDEDFNGYESDKVNKYFSGVIPTKEDWEELNESIKKHGLYNSYLLAVAP